VFVFGLKGCRTYLGCDGHATRYEHAIAAYPCVHKAELLLINKLNKVLDLVLEVGIWLQVLGGVRVGWLVGRWVCVAERHFVCGIGKVSGIGGLILKLYWSETRKHWCSRSDGGC